MRRTKRRPQFLLPLLIVVIAAGGVWWFWPRGEARTTTPASGASEDSQLSQASQHDSIAVPEAVIVEPDAAPPVADAAPSATHAAPPADEILTPVGHDRELASKPESDAPAPAQTSEPQDPPAPLPRQGTSGRLSNNPRINASLQRYKAGQVLAARQELNRMLIISRQPAEQDELRRHLRKIADETIFSRQQLPGDPLCETYTIQPNDYLVNIGKRFNLPHEALMLVNNINDPTRIQAGQRIKVLHGPFNVKIRRAEFQLDVYLQDLYLRSYPVGLGADQGTPLGEWLVKERLPNPTYYPPASAETRHIIPPNDPANPLGEHWIGLEGVAGDAVGRVGYGIHGTIEPETIGRAVSLGCVRMHNHDVAFLYKLMMPGSSRVTTLP